MNGRLDKLIQIIEKEGVFKKVFTVPEQKYDSPKFIAYIDKIFANRCSSTYLSDIKKFFNIFKNMPLTQ